MEGKDKQLTKNAIYLYLRMGIGTVLSLYTSRLVLQQLGIDGFGVYTVVGSVVVSLGFLSNTLSGAMARFFAYELGRDNEAKVKQLFNAAMRIELIIGLALLLILLTAGEWFVGYKLNLPSIDRWPARVVLYTTAISFFITILLVPYKSAITAREKFGVYAINELAVVILKLVAVICLSLFTANKLIIYSIFMAVIISGGAIGYAVYGRWRLPECVLSRHIDYRECKPLLTYAGIDLFGHFCGVISPQSVQWIGNIFFGVAVNAAIGITAQVSGAVASFVTSITQAFTPQIIKEYSSGNFRRMQNLASNCSVGVILLLGMLTVPLVSNIHFILNLWLSDVPPDAYTFCYIALIAAIPVSLTAVANSIVHASGKIKLLSVVNGTLYLLIPLVSYLLLRRGFSANIIYIVTFAAYLCQWLNSLFQGSRNISEFSGLRVLGACVLPSVVVGLTLTLCIWVNSFMGNNWIRVITDIAISVPSCGLYACYLYRKLKHQAG